MKVKLLILMLLAYAGAFGQTPSGYTKINARYDWIAGKFDSTMHVPGFATTPTLRSGGWTGAGAVGFDSVLHRFYFYSGGSWRRILNASDSTLYSSVTRLKDTAAVLRTLIGSGGGGGGSTNTGVGSGYQVAINGTNNIKSLKAGTDITLDSATSNEVKIHADTASGTTKLATQGYVARNTPGLDAVTAVKDSTTTRMVTQDTIKSSFGYNHGKFVIGDSLRSDKVAVFFGHSVVQGVGVSNYWETYPWKTSELFGWKMYNRGIAGTTLRHHSAGDSCMIDRLPLIPTYSSTYAALFFNYDINDANTSSYTLDTTGYKTDYARVIDTAKARGWPDNKIILLSANWVDTTSPSVYPKIRDYVTATLNIARTKNVVGIDLFRPTELGGAGVIIPDGDHPNTVGTDLISGVIAKNYPYSKRVGILETTTLLVKDSARITNTLRLGTDTASLDGDTPRLIVSGNQTTGKAYIAGPLYIGTKAYPVPGVVSWINVFPGSSGQPGLTVKDATGYYAQVGADGFASTSYGSTSRYRGIGITMDASNGFNFTGGGGFTYFYLNNDHSVFGNNVSITDLDSNLKVKGGFHVTGGFRHSGVPSASDTTTYKPYGINSSGQTVRMSYWPTIMATDSSGTYTPTLTNTTNVAASTAYTTYWRRVGDVVDVWGEVDIDATTAATISEMGISLPISVAITNTYNLAGTGAFEDNTVLQIKGDVANNRAKVRFTPVSLTNNKYSFHFTYKWIAP